MRGRQNSVTSLILIVLCLMVAVSATARDDDGRRDREKIRRVVILGDDGEEATVTFDGSRLRIVATDGDHVEVEEIDLEEIGELVSQAVSSAMQGVNQALDQMAQHEVTMRIRPDRKVHMKSDMTEMELDMEEILFEVQSAVTEVMRELETEFGDNSRSRLRFGDRHAHDERDERGRDWEEEEEASLREEIEALQREIRKLRAEMRDLDRDR